MALDIFPKYVKNLWIADSSRGRWKEHSDLKRVDKICNQFIKNVLKLSTYTPRNAKITLNN